MMHKNFFIIVFQKFKRNKPDRGREMRSVWKHSGFQPTSPRISEKVRDRANVTTDHQ